MDAHNEFEICFTSDCRPEKFLTVPHTFTYNIGGRRKMYFEAGVTGSLLLNYNTFYYLPGVIIGFHFVPFRTRAVPFGLYLSPVPFDYILNNPAGVFYLPYETYWGITF